MQQTPHLSVQPLTVDQLTSMLLKRRTTNPRFRLPLSKATAANYLLAAIIAEVQFRKGTFIDSVEFRQQLSCMAEWLTSSSSKFGILLCGYCGNGKTTWLKALQNLLNLLCLHDDYHNETFGLTIIKTNDLTEMNQHEMRQRISELTQKPLLAIDDLGAEPRDVMHYGNISSPVVRLIDKRYEAQFFTVITSNLTPEEITKVYGERTSDRLAEMMEILPFENDSYRNPSKRVRQIYCERIFCTPMSQPNTNQTDTSQ